MLRQEAEEKAQNAIASVLRYGSMISTAVMALGVTLAMFRGGGAARSGAPPPAALIVKIFEFDPMGIAELGIFFLLLTPVFRVAIAVVAFAIERDHKYVLISSGVLVVVLASIGFALR
jgi:uncharacterized membrane protein